MEKSRSIVGGRNTVIWGISSDIESDTLEGDVFFDTNGVAPCLLPVLVFLNSLCAVMFRNYGGTLVNRLFNI